MAPFVQSGRLISFTDDEEHDDEDTGACVTMQAGRVRLTVLVGDFAEVFGGYEHARRLLADAAVRVSTAPARATPPAARNCRRVATANLMVIILVAKTFRNDDAHRHGIARCGGRP